MPFVVGVAIAYLLFPLVKFIERHLPGKSPKRAALRRIVAILISVLIALAVLGLIVYFAVNAIVDSSSGIIENASHFIDTALVNIQEWASSMGADLPEVWQERLDDIAGSLGSMIDHALQDLIANSSGVIVSTFGVILSFAALPLFLFYLLKDVERLKTGVFGSLQPDVARHARRIFGIIEHTLGRYFLSQLILGLVVGLMTFIGLLFITPKVAVPLALINGFFEIIPTIGPILGGIVMAIIVLAVAPDQVIWVVILAIVVQLLENNILVPRVQAATMRLHPAVVLFLLVTGSYFWGFWGLVFVVPIVATFVDIFKYVHNIGLEPSPKETEAPPLDSGP